MNLIVSAALLLASGVQGQMAGEWLTAPGETKPRFQIAGSADKLPKPKISPKHRWIFEYSVGAYGKQSLDEELPLELKFRVFSQMRKAHGDPAPGIARMLLRLWDYSYRRLRTDHSLVYNNGILDVYLAFGGEPGSEQLFDEEFENGRARKVNTIYVYRVSTFEDPFEMAREIAHEYGHAILPPVGGFERPEDWANGYLGEKLFLRHLRDEIAAKRLTSADAKGATLAQLNAYLAKEADPLWRSVASAGPNHAALKGKGPAAMNAYLGLALYAETILPAPAFARSLKLIGSIHAADYPAAIQAAAAEIPTMSLRVPVSFRGKPLWIPLATGARMTGAKLVARSGGWAKVVPAGATITVVHSSVQS